jgi:hypothetical protein
VKYKEVLEMKPSNTIIPYILSKLARSYKNLGKIKESEIEEEKAMVFDKLINNNMTA